MNTTYYTVAQKSHMHAIDCRASDHHTQDFTLGPTVVQVSD